MKTARGWKQIKIASSLEDPLLIEVQIDSKDLASRGQEILDDNQRPLDAKEQEHALKRSTVCRLPSARAPGGCLCWFAPAKAGSIASCAP